MDVLLDVQELEIQETLRTFLKKECTPQLVRNAESSPGRISPSLWSQFCKLGWTGLCLPQSFGGQALPVSYLAILFEELGRYLAPIPAYSTLVPAMVIAKHGTAFQKQKILPPVIAGKSRLSFSLQEELENWTHKPSTVKAVRCEHGFEISGGKYYTNDIEDADFCLVAARILDGNHLSTHVSLFLVDPTHMGVHIQRLSPMAKDAEYLVTFNRVQVDDKCLVGTEDDSASFNLMQDFASILLASQMEGAARHAMEKAIAYVKEREAFGQPIAAFQAIQHMVADMVNQVDGTQLLAREALWRMAVGLPYRVEISQAKAFANKQCVAVCRTAQQMHGGIGFISEFDLNLWYRRVISWSLRGGTTGEHRSRVASAILHSGGPKRVGDVMHLPAFEDTQEVSLV